MKSSKNLTQHHSHQAESSQRPASEKNRRLAQQMEKRTYTGSIEQRSAASVSKVIIQILMDSFTCIYVEKFHLGIKFFYLYTLLF